MSFTRSCRVENEGPGSHSLMFHEVINRLEKIQRFDLLLIQHQAAERAGHVEYNLRSDAGGQLTHHRGSSVTNHIRPLFEGGGVHDAGGGDVQGHHIEPQ